MASLAWYNWWSFCKPRDIQGSLGSAVEVGLLFPLVVALCLWLEVAWVCLRKFLNQVTVFYWKRRMSFERPRKREAGSLTVLRSSGRSWPSSLALALILWTMSARILAFCSLPTLTIWLWGGEDRNIMRSPAHGRIWGEKTNCGPREVSHGHMTE